MKLYDYLNLMSEGNELTVWDKDYDIEIYFYSDRYDDKDKWKNSIWKLTEVLDITEINKNGVVINLSDMIENKLDDIKNLFKSCDIGDIMDDMPSIFSGNVNEEWIEQFAKIMVE